MEKEKIIYSKLNRNTKWLGIIDYKSLIFIIIISVSLWIILNSILENTLTVMYIIVILLIPIIGIFYANRTSDSVVDMVYIIIRYAISCKNYVYKTQSRDYWLK